MKKLILITLLLSVYFVPAAFAHSHLERSTPGDGEVVTENLREIILTFNGDIEEGSTFELLDSYSKSISIEDITIADSEMIGAIPNGLDNGNYTVVWNIISADGHQMEGEFSFDVKVAEPKATPENNNSEEQADEMDEDSNVKQENASKSNSDSEDNAIETESDAEKNVSNNQTEGKESSNLVPIIVVVLILAIIIFFIALRRKK